MTFAAVTLLATLAVSATTLLLSRQYLIDQRQSSAVRQALLNARVVRDLLKAGDTEAQAIMDATVGEPGTLGLLRVDGQWFTSGVGADPSDLPSGLVEMLAEGTAGRQRISAGGQSRLVIGVPLDAVGAQYIEIVSMEGIERNLRNLIVSLVIGSAGTTLAGTLVGVYVSRRVLRPVHRMSAVASGIAGGDLLVRLDVRGDRDLDPLVVSFNEMVDALQTRIEREQRFASDVSHELRTPLAALKTAIEVVERRSVGSDSGSGEAIRLLARQVDYFERLVLDLLEISRFDSGVERPDLEERDLVEVVSSISRELGGPPVHAELADPITTGVDRRRMQRILGNLLENAERYAGGATAITITRNGDWVSISVRDAGNGIAPDERNRVFERFWRGRDARHQSSKGSGLGLSLVVEHVRVLAGRIRVGDAEGGGADFIVELPLEPGW